jgi:hypothetical protein
MSVKKLIEMQERESETITISKSRLTGLIDKLESLDDLYLNEQMRVHVLDSELKKAQARLADLEEKERKIDEVTEVINIHLEHTKPEYDAVTVVWNLLQDVKITTRESK